MSPDCRRSTIRRALSRGSAGNCATSSSGTSKSKSESRIDDESARWRRPPNNSEQTICFA
eukprot:scaffold652865_cov65-Prasinocladus_malaysianus.AAC.1